MRDSVKCNKLQIPNLSLKVRYLTSSYWNAFLKNAPEGKFLLCNRWCQLCCIDKKSLVLRLIKISTLSNCSSKASLYFGHSLPHLKQGSWKAMLTWQAIKIQIHQILSPDAWWCKYHQYEEPKSGLFLDFTSSPWTVPSILFVKRLMSSESTSDSFKSTFSSESSCRKDIVFWNRF